MLYPGKQKVRTTPPSCARRAPLQQRLPKRMSSGHRSVPVLCCAVAHNEEGEEFAIGHSSAWTEANNQSTRSDSNYATELHSVI